MSVTYMISRHRFLAANLAHSSHFKTPVEYFRFLNGINIDRKKKRGKVKFLGLAG